MTPTNAEVKLLDDPTADSIFVSLDRVHRCYPELTDHSWTGHSKRARRTAKASNQSPGDSTPVPYTGPVTRAQELTLMHSVFEYCVYCVCMKMIRYNFCCVCL